MEASKIVTAENAGAIKEVIKFLADGDVVDPVVVKLYALTIAVSEAEKQAESEMLDIPTWKRRYLGRDSELCCPRCSSANVFGAGPKVRTYPDPTVVSQDVGCVECESRWRDWFRLVDVEMLPKGGAE